MTQHLNPTTRILDFEQKSARIHSLEAEIRRLTGCLLAIAGADGCGAGSLKAAAYEAATMRASVADLTNKLGLPAPLRGKQQ